MTRPRTIAPVPELTTEEQECVRLGRILNACILYRRRTHCELIEAKRIVEAHADERARLSRSPARKERRR